MSRQALARVRDEIESAQGACAPCSDDVLLTELTARGLLDGDQVTRALKEECDLEVAEDPFWMAW